MRLRGWKRRSRLELGLPRVEPPFEVPADALAAREHRLEADAAWRELHDLDVARAVAVTTRVRGRLIEGPEAFPLPLSPHVPGHLAEGARKGNPLVGGPAALCDEKIEDQDAAQRQLHGLQSRPEST